MTLAGYLMEGGYCNQLGVIRGLCMVLEKVDINGSVEAYSHEKMSKELSLKPRSQDNDLSTTDKPKRDYPDVCTSKISSDK